MEYEELGKIREKLKEAVNPVILFDDDPDGLCSYLLIKKFMGKGSGICVRGEPFVDGKYVSRVKAHEPDLIIILDKPMVREEFLDNIHTPIIWIDHHGMQEPRGTLYFNPKKYDEEDARSTSYWCYQITKENLWIAFTGIVGDYSLDLFDEFKEKYKDLVIDKVEKPTDLTYNSKIGEIIRIISNILKGKTSDINRNIELITKIKDPYELLEGKSEEADELLSKHSKIKKDFDKLAEEAEKSVEGEILKFIYVNEKYSFTSELSNYLNYKFPEKFILICRKNGTKYMCSLRSHKVDLREVVEKCINGLDGYGGGHKYACGATIDEKDFDEFLRRFKEEVS
jgi:single-stranded DNA-specific DHH superfamily exonuclease